MTNLPLEDVRSVLGRTGAALSPSSVAGALRGLGLLVSESTVRDTVDALRRESAGAGPLEQLLGLRGVTDWRCGWLRWSAADSMRERLGLMRGCPTAPGFMPCSACSPTWAPACHCECRPAPASPWPTG